jgi:hypothetical protein
MKPSLLFSALLLTTFTVSHAQIPNNGFEDWITDGSFEEPAGWATTNGAVPNDLFFACTKSTDHFPAGVGQYSMRLESNLLFQQGGWGISVTDTFAYPFEPAFAIEGHPNTLYGYYKYDSQAGDEAWITLALFNNGEMLHTSQFRGPASDVSEWTLFQLDIEDYDVADSATLMIFNFYPTSQIDGPNGNSVLWVDNLSFDSPITSIAENQEARQFDLYPNPASEMVTVDMGTMSAEGSILSVYSMLGSLVMSEAPKGNRHHLNVSALHNGSYVVELRDREQVTYRKLHVSH